LILGYIKYDFQEQRELSKFFPAGRNQRLTISRSRVKFHECSTKHTRFSSLLLRPFIIDSTSWGTDLSFSFVYVRGIDPTGAAALSRLVSIGDQLCEVTPISSAKGNDNDDAISSTPVNLIGAPFDYVMNTFATLDKTVIELDFVFFSGTRDELKAVCTGGDLRVDGTETITVTVVQNKGSASERIQRITAPVGVNVRELLVNNSINVYQSVTRWTNCQGKQLCGTCIVNIPTGGIRTNRKSMDEASTLRENPDTYRLSCVSFAYGDITVETFPPIKAAQWTR
jgi:ferredoxin